MAKRPPGHHPLALDLMGLERPDGSLMRSSRTSWIAGRAPARSYYGWERPIHGPGSGRVVAAVDGLADRMMTGALSSAALLVYASFIFKPPIDPQGQPNIQPNVGNYVMVQIAPQQIAFYAHLRNGSIRKEENQTIAQGEVLGSMGNSGNTTAPHVHVHVMDQSIDLATANLVPFVFDRYDLWNGTGWCPQSRVCPSPGQILRS